MSDIKYKNLEVSSLVDLRAELFKKQEAFKQAKLNRSSESQKRKGIKLKGEEIPKKAKSSAKTSSKTHVSEEEDAALRNSRLALEKKAKLYDQIVSRKVTLDEEDHEMYMVDFRKKITHHDVKLVSNENLASPKVKEVLEEQVDISPLQKISNLYEKFFVQSNDDTNILKSVPNKKSETNANTEGPVHYQNVQHNEIRDHGVGYFAFSQSEDERKAQMDSLNLLRQKTEHKQAAFKISEDKRKSALQARLAKICKRRNIDESAINKLIPKSDNDFVNTEGDNIDLNEIPLPEGNPVEEIPLSNPTPIRPWDKGKIIVGSEVIIEKPKKAPKRDWMEERRSERIEEFAPPSAYS